MVLKSLACIVFFLISLSNAQELELLNPKEKPTVRMGSTEALALRLKSFRKFKSSVHVKVAPDNPKLFVIHKRHTFEFRRVLSDEIVSLRLKIRGRFLGHANLKVVASEGNETLLEELYPVDVLRDAEGEKLGILFTGVMVIVIGVNNFLMGTQLDIQVIFECVKKPVGPIIGVFCQFLIMPLLAYAWGWAILGDYPTLWLGYFAVGCSPGGGASNFMTILLDGNIDLSVTMTFFSNFAAFLLMPLWLYTLTRTFYPEFVQIPFFNIFGSLLGLIIPACFGLVFITWKPEYAKKCRQYIKISTIIILILIFCFGIYANLFIFFLIKWYTIVAGFILPWTGYAVAFGISLIMRQPIKNCVTIAIETGIQNAGIPIVLLKFSLPEPDSDLSLVVPICVNLFTTLPLWFVLFFRKFRDCVKRKETTTEKEGSSHDEVDYNQYEPKIGIRREPSIVMFCRQSSDIICTQGAERESLTKSYEDKNLPKITSTEEKEQSEEETAEEQNEVRPKLILNELGHPR